jgi:Winged helix DNA-binding domain
VLGMRALNRALLERQMLLHRCARPEIEVIEHLVGMQAQVPRDPYMGLWSRMEGFNPDELARLITERRVAHSPLMRATIHLATAHDCVALRPPMQPVLNRTLKGAFGRRLAGVDLDALTDAGRVLLGVQPRTFAELRLLLGEQWSDYDPAALGYAISYLVPLVQVPPRGLWDASGQATWTTTEAWLGRPMETDPSPDEMVMRYLAAFGPASVNDIQAWCGMIRLREVVERLRPGLLTFRDECGRELFDLPDAPRPDTPAPPRFLPHYDNVFLSHADRTRIISDEHRKRIGTDNGLLSAVLVDGFIAATWVPSPLRTTT